MEDEPILLSWTKYLPVSEGQDPLGLNLRVNARLAGQLFYCITSITPRARYYSFFAWAISVANEMSPAMGLRERLRIVEKAFAAACVASHEGAACDDGRLVGVDEITKWHAHAAEASVDISPIPFAKNPGIDAYWASLVNLGLFKAEPQVDEVEPEVPSQEVGGNVRELSPNGTRLAQAYAQVAGAGRFVSDLKASRLNMAKAAEWGRRGCLCSIRKAGEDRDVLRDLFFNRLPTAVESHRYRKHTLLLLMALSEPLTDAGCTLDATRFGEAVCFGAVMNEDGSTAAIPIDPLLADIRNRWRMFYAHYYLSAALENLFVCTMVEANQKVLEGFTLQELVSELNGASINQVIQNVLGISYKGTFAELSLTDIYVAASLPEVSFDEEGSRVFDREVRLEHPLSEGRLLGQLTPKAAWGTKEALAHSILLTATILMRFIKDEGTPYGNWLTNATVNNEYENVTVPVVLKQIRKAFYDPLATPLGELLAFVLEHFSVRLHQSLAYQKSGSFLYTDEGRIRGRKRYEWPGYQNGRLPSAVLILKDLGLLHSEDGDSRRLRLTDDGRQWLKHELEGLRDHE